MNKGRHTKPDAIVRTGKMLTLWLSVKDMERLNHLAKNLETSKADAVRKLIREFDLDKE